MAHILAIGVATLDIINHVDSYPLEDDKIRASAQDIRRGGNAANSLVVLTQLGQRCSWAGTLSNDEAGKFIRVELQRYGVDTSNSCLIPGGRTPTSYITHNRSNGSRTIIHYRDLPEYGFDSFRSIDLSSYDWLHFEGRECRETVRMLQLVRQRQPHTPISIEIEKSRPDISALFGLADLLLFSRVFANDCGYQDGAGFLHAMRKQIPAADLVCAWGDKGAWALSRDNQASFSPAFPPDRLVDTLAAGDSFNAAMIDARTRGLPLSEALTAACQLAGRKCGIAGLDIPK
jgi:ketohexokinase